jgi:hypothetical protein
MEMIMRHYGVNISQQVIHNQSKKLELNSSYTDENRLWVHFGFYPKTLDGMIMVDKPILLTVPSLNIVAGNHRIVLFDGEIYDPSNLKTYDKVSDLRGYSEATSVEHIGCYN